eukprot:gene29671-biopygen111899
MPVIRAFVPLAPPVTVLLVDFWLTKGFADGMHDEQQRVRSSITVAAEIARELEQYDVEAAERRLEDGGDALPIGLCLALEGILDNLHAYRPYLPDALLREGEVAIHDGPESGGGASHVSADWSSTPSDLSRSDLGCSIHTVSTPSTAGSTPASVAGDHDADDAPAASREGSRSLSRSVSSKRLPDGAPPRAAAMTTMSLSLGCSASNKFQKSLIHATGDEVQKEGSNRSLSLLVSNAQCAEEGESPFVQHTADAFAVGLDHKVVSLTCVNVCRYHSTGPAGGDSPNLDQLVQFHAAYIEMMRRASRPRGSVDAVLGDRVRVTHNAAAPCGGHRAAAADCALRCSEQAGDGARELAAWSAACCAAAPQLSVGVSTGSAFVGKVGTEALKHSAVLSTLCGWAQALERVSAQGFGSCVADAPIVEQAAGIDTRVIPIRVMHSKHQRETVARLWALEGRHEQ